jgi:tetratricopeptide (TPR) repeat protein
VRLARSAVDLAPGEADYWSTLGLAHYRAGSFEDGAKALGKAVELRSGGDAYDWIFLAMTRWQLGQKDEARRWFDRSADWSRDHPDEELQRFQAEAAQLLGLAAIR